MSVWIAPEPHESSTPSLEALRDAIGRTGARLATRLQLPLALCGGLFAALAVLQLLSPAKPLAPASEPEIDIAAGVWSRQPDAPLQLALTTPAFAGLTRAAAVWSRTRAGQHETEERLMLGDIDRAEPFVLAIAESGPEGERPVSLFLASARHAADAGLAIGRFTPIADPAEGQSMVELGRISLARAVGFGPVRSECVAWRTSAPGLARLEGIACLPQERPVADKIACLLHDIARASATMDAPARLALLEATGTVVCETEAPTPARAGLTRVARTRQ